MDFLKASCAEIGYFLSFFPRPCCEPSNLDTH